MATCYHCDQPITPDAEWPDNGVHDDGLDFHDGCSDAWRIERAKAFQAFIETQPLLDESRVGRENASGGTRVTGRPAVCNCKWSGGEIVCPRHGKWAV